MLFVKFDHFRISAARVVGAAVLLLAFFPCCGMDFYLWQRRHTPEVKTAVREFYNNSSGRLYCIAGELEKSGNAVCIKPSDVIDMKRSAAVIRIHIGVLKKHSYRPDLIAQKIVRLYEPWRLCKNLEIDLDIPERKFSFYADLMNELRKSLPDTILSATVLPCHLKDRRAFAELADACDFYVLQVHGLNKEKGYWSIFDYTDSVKAVEQAKSFKRPFKIALPLYCNNIDRNTFVKPDLQKVSDLAKISPRVIGFRLGIPGDGNSLNWATAAAVCRGAGYQPELSIEWLQQSNGAWILNVKNVGCFSEDVSLQIPSDLRKIIDDADVFSDALFDRDCGVVKFRLPPAEEKINVMWARFQEDPNEKSLIIIKGNR